MRLSPGCGGRCDSQIAPTQAAISARTQSLLRSFRLFLLAFLFCRLLRWCLLICSCHSHLFVGRGVAEAPWLGRSKCNAYCGVSARGVCSTRRAPWSVYSIASMKFFANRRLADRRTAPRDGRLSGHRPRLAHVADGSRVVPVASAPGISAFSPLRASGEAHCPKAETKTHGVLIDALGESRHSVNPPSPPMP
jgi:hypothetical protein